MNRVSLVAVLAVMLLPACGNSPPPPTQAEVDAAVAAAEAAEAAAKETGPAAAPRAPRNVDPNANAFPPGYVGEDFAALKREFDGKLAGAERTKYETTQEFEKRMANVAQVLAPIDITREYGFKLTPLDYDADAGAFRTNYVVGCQSAYNFDGEKPWMTCALAPPVLTEDTSYVGSNAFGTERVVEKQRGEIVSAAFALDSKATKKVFGGTLDSDLKWQCKADRAKARSLDGKTVSLLIVGRIAGAYHVKGRGELTEAKVTDAQPRDAFLQEQAMPLALTQVVCYVEETGEILDRLRVE